MKKNKVIKAVSNKQKKLKNSNTSKMSGATKNPDSIICIDIIVKQAQVALNLPYKYSERLQKLKLIYKSIHNNIHGWFDNTPTSNSMDRFLELINDFSQANDDVDENKPDAKKKRIPIWKKTLRAAKRIRDKIQGLVDDNPDFAEQIAEDACMDLIFHGGSEKHYFSGESPRENEVDLTAVKLHHRQATEWDMSYNPANPRSWFQVRIPSTLAIFTTVKDLPSDVDVYFRFRTILKDGPTDWSDIIMVHVK